MTSQLTTQYILQSCYLCCYTCHVIFEYMVCTLVDVIGSNRGKLNVGGLLLNWWGYSLVSGGICVHTTIYRGVRQRAVGRVGEVLADRDLILGRQRTQH